MPKAKRHPWTLKQKLGLVALIYALSIVCNLGASAFCMLVYFRSAFREAESASAHQHQTDTILTLIRRQRTPSEHSYDPDELLAAYAETEREVSEAMPHLEQVMATPSLLPLWSQIQIAVEHMQEAVRGHPRPVSGMNLGESASAPGFRPLIELDRLLSQASDEFGRRRQQSIIKAASGQGLVVRVLMVNTIVGAILCVVGLWFVRRWVVRPVAELRAATSRLSQGDLAMRIVLPYQDEMGELGNEVNHMASQIKEMQARLVEKERRLAASEMVTRLEDNIRHPLSEIRSLAKTNAARMKEEDEIAACQQRIIDAVDQFQNWLHKLREAVSPTEPHLQMVRIEELLDDIVTALRPLLQRSQVKASVLIASAMPEVRVDALQFEQAVVALVTNAVEASQPGQEVRIEVKPLADTTGGWELAVEDDGIGIPSELQEKVLLPFFTTKRDGNGIGLAMAGAVVRLHGGKLSIHSRPGQGSRFAAHLPGLIEEPACADEPGSGR